MRFIIYTFDTRLIKKYFASIVNVIFNAIINSINIDSSFIAFKQKEIVELLEKEIFYQSIRKTYQQIFEFSTRDLLTKLKTQHWKNIRKIQIDDSDI
jgi:ABC-type branched-subunit amino acid transport system ATPase component